MTGIRSLWGKSTEARVLGEPRVPVSLIQVLARILHQKGEIRIRRVRNDGTKDVYRDQIDVGDMRICVETSKDAQRCSYVDVVSASLEDAIRKIANEVLE